MRQAVRVFGTTDVEPRPELIAELVHEFARDGQTRFAGDAEGWFQADIKTPLQRLCVDRYSVAEDGIRGELNAWAAWLEGSTDHPNRQAVMERIVACRQLYLLSVDTQSPPAEEVLAIRLGTLLARTTDGIYYMDSQGFFAPEGVLLLPEPPERHSSPS